MNPTECKYCGCNKFNADSVTMTRFRCGSSYWHNEEMWQIANGCAAKCAVQLVELRSRIRRAVEVLEGARRICVVISDENDDPIESEHDGVIYVESTEADRAIEILKGETDGKAD